MSHYCTLFDRNYLSRGLALQRSLLRHANPFTLHVLCLDETTHRVLEDLDLQGVKPVPLDTLLDWDRDLAAARKGRAALEFFFACKASLMLYTLEHERSSERISYLDADLYFFSNAASADAECAGSTIALSPHRFAARSAHRTRFGHFNAGWLNVDKGAEALRFLRWWRGRCLESSSMVVEDTRFGDQKYLDQVPLLFRGVKAVLHPGVNAGPWNIDAQGVECNGESVHIRGHPLVFFHFHRLRRMLFGLHDSGLYEYGVELTPTIRRGIYVPYLTELASCERDLGGYASHFSGEAGPLRRVAQTARALLRHTVVSAGG